jgi:hypothetical protein
MPQHSERPASQIDANTVHITQFFIPQVERQTGDLHAVHRI